MPKIHLRHGVTVILESKATSDIVFSKNNNCQIHPFCF